jgi:hypothetical protein
MKKETSTISLENSSKIPQKNILDQSLSVPVLRVYGDRAVICLQNVYRTRKSIIKETSLKNLEDNHVKGRLSRKSLLHIRKHLHAWCEAVRVNNIRLNNQFERKKHHISMITLTLSSEQMHKDKYLKKNLFSRYVEEIKRKYDIDHYFMRYENQKNGNLHAHLLIDKYIPANEIQKIWNAKQDALGYIDEFEKKHNHRFPPSTHVESFYNDVDRTNYLLEYTTKKSKNKPVEGRQYSMSHSLKEIDVFETIITNKISNIVDQIIKTGTKTIHQDEFFTVILCDRQYLANCLGSQFQFEYNEYYQRCYNYLYRNNLHPYEEERKKSEVEVINEEGKSYTVTADHVDKLVETVVQQVIPFD